MVYDSLVSGNDVREKIEKRVTSPVDTMVTKMNYSEAQYFKFHRAFNSVYSQQLQHIYIQDIARYFLIKYRRHSLARARIMFQDTRKIHKPIEREREGARGRDRER